MALGRMKALYVIIVVALAVILLSTDALAQAIAAATLLLGAWPIYHALTHGSAQAGKEDALDTLTRDLLPLDHPDSPQSAPEARDSR